MILEYILGTKQVHANGGLATEEQHMERFGQQTLEPSPSLLDQEQTDDWHESVVEDNNTVVESSFIPENSILMNLANLLTESEKVSIDEFHDKMESIMKEFHENRYESSAKVTLEKMERLIDEHLKRKIKLNLRCDHYERSVSNFIFKKIIDIANASSVMRITPTTISRYKDNGEEAIDEWEEALEPLFNIVNKLLLAGAKIESDFYNDRMFERYLELKLMAELARELNSQGYRTKSDIFKKATVRRIITNPIYMGKIRHYEKEYEGKHEAIIEEEKWQKAQELIRNQPYRKAKYEEALLKGIIKCKSCDVNMTLTYAKKESKRYRYYVCNNHLRGKNCESINRTIVAGEVEKEVMKKAEQLYEKWREKTEEKIEKLWENLSFGKQKEVVKKLIKAVLVREDGIELYSELEEKFISIKKKGKKCTVIEPEGKTNNALLKAVVRAYLWKRELEEGKYGSVKELSAKINIGTRRIQQILRLNYLAPKIKEDIVNGKQSKDLKLVDLREIPMLWSEQMEKFYV